MNDTMNQKEKIMGFAYVFLLFLSITGICCFLLYYYNSDFKAFTQKKFVITKMERMRKFQSDQSHAIVIVDSLYNKINNYNPGVNAIYVENDIRFMINDLKAVYDKQAWDTRYKCFQHISDFYLMWFTDKKDLWSKQDNVIKFRKNLEECEIGLNNKKNDFNNIRR